MKLLGVKIAFGYISEAEDFAIPLAHCGEDYDALVLNHNSPRDRESAGKFEAVAKVPMARFDAVVGSAEGGVGEIVADGETGLLAPPGDIDAWATHLAKLLDEPETPRRMGASGRQRIAANFCPEGLGGAYSGLLGRIVNSQAAPPPEAKAYAAR